MLCVRPTPASSSWPSLPLDKSNNRTRGIQGRRNSLGLIPHCPAPNVPFQDTTPLFFPLCSPLLTDLFSSLGSLWTFRVCLAVTNSVFSWCVCTVSLCALPGRWPFPAPFPLTQCSVSAGIWSHPCKQLIPLSWFALTLVKSKKYIYKTKSQKVGLAHGQGWCVFMWKYELSVEIFCSAPPLPIVWIHDSLHTGLSLFRRSTFFIFSFLLFFAIISSCWYGNECDSYTILYLITEFKFKVAKDFLSIFFYKLKEWIMNFLY